MDSLLSECSFRLLAVFKGFERLTAGFAYEFDSDVIWGLGFRVWRRSHNRRVHANGVWQLPRLYSFTQPSFGLKSGGQNLLACRFGAAVPRRLTINIYIYIYVCESYCI